MRNPVDQWPSISDNLHKDIFLGADRKSSSLSSILSTNDVDI